jgi:hypothetical protein
MGTTEKGAAFSKGEAKSKEGKEEGCFTMITAGQKILDGLEGFLRKLRRGDDIQVTEVRRFDTPDGPMHTFEKKTLGREQDEDRIS